MPVHFDQEKWLKEFESMHERDSPARHSYHGRIKTGVDFWNVERISYSEDYLFWKLEEFQRGELTKSEQNLFLRQISLVLVVIYCFCFDGI